MLLILWRAISIEFWRLLILTVSVVVAIIAFAVTIKPLADGKLSVDQAIRFMFYAIPPMLAYALPFAAGFAATITYHRMSSENEVTAVFASGVSHKRILIPAVVSGLLLASGLLVLNDQVIPRFLKEMERMVTQDFAKLFVNSLQSGESAKVGNNEIHADFVERVDPEPGSPVIDQFLLGGVAIVKADPDGTVTIDGTAQRAWIQILPAWALSPEDRARIGNDEATTVLMKFIDMTINREGSPITVDPFTLPAFPIPRVFKDDPKFMSSADMRDLKNHPDRMNFVETKRVDLAKALAADQVFRQVAAQARSGSSIEFMGSDGSQITILAGGFRPSGGQWSLFPQRQTSRIELQVIDHQGRVDRLRAQEAKIVPQHSTKKDPLQTQISTQPTLGFTLSLSGVEVLGSIDEDRPNTEIESTEYINLRYRQDPLAELIENKPSLELIPYANAYIESVGADRAEYLQQPVDRLSRQIEDLQREIMSKLHERIAMAGAAMIMVIAGSVIALKLRHSQSLVVYQWSFFPALGTLILISGGQQSIHNTGAMGIPVIYSGVLGLAIYTWFLLRKVSKQ